MTQLLVLGRKLVGLSEVSPHLPFTQDLVLSSGSGSLGPNLSALQLHHGHARAWLWTPLMDCPWLMDWFPSLTPDLCHHPWTCCAWLRPSSLPCSLPEGSEVSRGWWGHPLCLTATHPPLTLELPPLLCHGSAQCHTSSHSGVPRSSC